MKTTHKRHTGTSGRIILESSLGTQLDWLQALPGDPPGGRVVLRGSHLLLHHSRTQACVALSSVEAEPNAASKMDCEITRDISILQ